MKEASRTSETSADNYFTRQYIPEDKHHQGDEMKEASRTSETSADNYFTRQYNPEDSELQKRLHVFTMLTNGSGFAVGCGNGAMCCMYHSDTRNGGNAATEGRTREFSVK
jgi:hypothetical protein